MFSDVEAEMVFNNRIDGIEHLMWERKVLLRVLEGLGETVLSEDSAFKLSKAIGMIEEKIEAEVQKLEIE